MKGVNKSPMSVASFDVAHWGFLGRLKSAETMELKKVYKPSKSQI